MSTQYRDPPKWKQNASERLHVEMFTRLQAASVFCERLIGVANIQLEMMEQHVKEGGDPLEAMLGTDKYEKIRAAAEAEAIRARCVSGGAIDAKAAQGSGSFSGSSEKVPDPLESAQAAGPGANAPGSESAQAAGEGQAPFASQKEPACPEPVEGTPKRKYMPRVNAQPLFVLAYRAMVIQQELAPAVKALGEALVAAGIDVRKLQNEDVIAEIVRDELGIELEQVDQATYDEMCKAIRQAQQMIRDLDRQWVELEGQPPPGKGKATDG